MNNLFFLFPIYYSYKTRFKKIPSFISWIIIYFFPVLYLGLIALGFSLQNVLLSIVAILLIYSLYEVGYIQNDTETIKREKNPTKRLLKDQLSFYESNKIFIYLTRISFSLFLSTILYINLKVDDVIVFLIVSWSILIIYQLYNRVRSILNLYLHFWLVLIRYSSILLLSWTFFKWELFITSVFVFPVINLIERSSEKRFDITIVNKRLNSKDDKRQLGIFRIKYYSFLFVIYLILFILNLVTIYSLVLIFYYLFYRTISFILLKDKL